ncbi:MAG TPA: hypothetical protein DEP84_24005, partial [Chloroflexi bacterium]|nr:hypothetical protein [Chloroflexota bacterium]
VQTTLLRLAAGGFVVDTPGIREFGLSDLHRHELARFFPEIAALAPHCRFKDCAHSDEPECAVRAGVSQGEILTSRYHSYRQIYASLPT